MKKILVLLVFIFSFANVFSQSNPYPTTQNLANTPTTLVVGNAIKERSFIYTTFTDTTAANSYSAYLKTYPFATIATTSDSSLWIRNGGATRWMKIASSVGGTNIYNSNGSLTGDRVLSGTNLYNLGFDAVTSFRAEANAGTGKISSMNISPDSVLFQPNEGNFIIDSLNNSSAQNTILGWVSTAGSNRGKVGYTTLGSGLSLSSGVLNTSGSAAGNVWSITGNSGTTAGTNFIGTTDNQKLVFKVNGVYSGQIGTATDRRTFFGYNSGNGGVTNNSDVGIGTNSLSVNTGGGNVAIGTNAMVSATAAHENTAVGLNVMYNSLTGFRQSAFGENSMYQGWGGEHNSGFGAMTLEVISGANYNTALGSNSLRGNKQGSNNTASGFFSLLQNTTAVSSVTITNGGSGYTSATCTFSAPEAATSGTVSTTATGTVTINAGAVTGIVVTDRGSGYSTEKGAVTVTINGDGTGATGTVVLISGEDNTVSGYAAMAFSRIGKGNVAIGKEAGQGIANASPSVIDDNMTFIGYGSSRRVGLSSETKLEKSTAIGYNSKVGKSNTMILGYDGSTQAQVGIGKDTVTTGFSFEVASSDIMVNNIRVGLGNGAVSTNTAVGFHALDTNTTGARNVIVGHEAFSSSVNRSDNVAVGYQAMKNLKFSTRNTAVGALAMFQVPAGNYGAYNMTAVGEEAAYNGGNVRGVAIGYKAMYNAYTNQPTSTDGTVAVGAESLLNITQALNNTAVGQFSGGGITTGGNNTAVGLASMGRSFLGVGGAANGTGGNNTAIGANSLFYTGSSTNNTAIGYNVFNGSSFAPSIGYNIGLGSGAGTALTTGDYNVILGSYSGANIATKSKWMVFSDGFGNDRMYIDSVGNVGIGTASPITKLDVSGYNTTNSQLAVGSLEMQPYDQSNGWLSQNIYYNSGFKYRANGAGGLFYFLGTEGQFRFAASGTAGGDPGINSIAQFKVNADGTVVIGGTASASAGTYTGATLLANSSKVGIGQNVYVGDITSTPSAYLHLKAGTATASTAPLKFTSGTNLTTAEAGVMEYDGSNFFLSPSTTRKRIPLFTNATPGNGELLIGNGTDFTKATLTAGQNISITNGAGSVTIATDITLAQGTYTPTLTNTTNITSSTAYTTHYFRVGDQITVWGQVEITSTAAGAVELRMSLPVATSNFINTYEAAGTASEGTADPTKFSNVRILAVTSAGVVKFIYDDQTSGSKTFSFSFSYKYVTP